MALYNPTQSFSWFAKDLRQWQRLSVKNGAKIERDWSFKIVELFACKESRLWLQNGLECRNNTKNNALGVNLRNTTKPHQPRGYLEDFLDKFWLNRLADGVKMGLFSPIWKTVPIWADLFVQKHPISVRNVNVLHGNSQITQMYPILVS